MSDQEIHEIVLRIVKLLKEEDWLQRPVLPVSTNLYVIFGDCWSNAYFSLMEDLSGLGGFRLNAIVAESWSEMEYSNLKKGAAWNQIVSLPDIETINFTDESMSLFASADREFVVKTALGLHDTPKTRWVRKAMESGQRIAILKSGLDRFSGKEPKSYVDKILSYHRILLDYEIEIIDSAKNLLIQK